MPFDPQQTLGPLGALVLAILAVFAFTKEIVTPGSRTRRAEDIAKSAVEGLLGAQSIQKSLVEALEERNRVDAEQQATLRAATTKRAKGRDR